MASVLSVNIGVPRTTRAKSGRTGIDKQPASGPVRVESPGPRRAGHPGSGLAGDACFDIRYHGGTDRAVYSYGREDLDRWQTELDRDLPSGVFGENLTTVGLDVNHAVLGERWAIGAEVILEVTGPRIPCVTFALWMEEKGWLKRFTAQGLPGAYLRIVRGGELQAGDEIRVLSRPDHGVTVARAFCGMMGDRALASDLWSIHDSLSADIVEFLEQRRIPSEA